MMQKDCLLSGVVDLQSSGRAVKADEKAPESDGSEILP